MKSLCNFIRTIFSTKRGMVYLILIIVSSIILVSGILVLTFCNCSYNNLGNGLISLFSSLFAGVLTAVLLDIADYHNKNEQFKNESDDIFRQINFYTLNLIYEFILKSFDDWSIDIDIDKSVESLFIESLEKYRSKGKIAPEYFEYSFTYHLRMLSMILNRARYANPILKNYEISFMDINQYIEEYFEKRDKLIFDRVANIIDLLINLEPISLNFEKPIKNFRKEIALLNIHLIKKEKAK